MGNSRYVVHTGVDLENQTIRQDVEFVDVISDVLADRRSQLFTQLVHLQDEGIRQALIQLGWTPPETKPLPPVEGDVLPAIGSTVLIHLARSDSWVPHKVVGYYVWPPLKPGGGWRVNVRVENRNGYLNARPLEDVRPAP